MSSEINDLERLIALRDSGEIDETEFNTLKQQLLAPATTEESSSEERKQLVGVTVVVTLLVCGAVFGIYKAVSGSSENRPTEEQVFIDRFVSTGVSTDFGGLGEIGFGSSDARCVGGGLVDRVGIDGLNSTGVAWLTSDELPPELTTPFLESMSDCVDLKGLAAIGMAEGAEIDVALFECALEDLSEMELIQLLSVPADEFSFDEDAAARVLFPVIGNLFDCAAELPDVDLDELMDFDW
ncbi:MAG: SHOCT domain-containing protein [Candidatus Poriferisodalaceae bacterium]